MKLEGRKEHEDRQARVNRDAKSWTSTLPSNLFEMHEQSVMYSTTETKRGFLAGGMCWEFSSWGCHDNMWAFTTLKQDNMIYYSTSAIVVQHKAMLVSGTDSQSKQQRGWILETCSDRRHLLYSFICCSTLFFIFFFIIRQEQKGIIQWLSPFLTSYKLVSLLFKTRITDLWLFASSTNLVSEKKSPSIILQDPSDTYT